MQLLIKGLKVTEEIDEDEDLAVSVAEDNE